MELQLLLHGAELAPAELAASRVLTACLPLLLPCPQLPPVGKGREGAAARRFCFEAQSWGRCVQESLSLTKVFRQVRVWRHWAGAWPASQQGRAADT